jgi:hypothetical protein
MITNSNTFQIFLEGELLIDLPNMRRVIQQQHGVKYNVFSIVNLVKFAMKDK